MGITVFDFMDSRFQCRKKGRDKVQKRKYQELHNKIAVILQKHPGGLYRSDIQEAIDNERSKESNSENLTLVTLRKHLKDFINIEKLVIETDINSTDGSRMPRKKLFWAFHHEGIRIVNDLLVHWLKSLETDYNKYVNERNGNTTVEFSQVADYYLRSNALFFLPLSLQRPDGTKVLSYFLKAVPLEDMNKEPEKNWKQVYERSLKALQFLKDTPGRKTATVLNLKEAENNG